MVAELRDASNCENTNPQSDKYDLARAQHERHAATDGAQAYTAANVPATRTVLRLELTQLEWDLR